MPLETFRCTFTANRKPRFEVCGLAFNVVKFVHLDLSKQVQRISSMLSVDVSVNKIHVNKTTARLILYFT